MTAEPAKPKFLTLLRLWLLQSLTFVVITLERLTEYGWRIGCWVLLFAALWLFAIPAAFGLWAGLAASFIFYAGCLFFLWMDVRHFRLPIPYAIARRIEIDSEVRHRPLSTLHDRRLEIGENQMGSRILWWMERERKESTLSLLRRIKPRAFLAGRDPYALRLILMLAVIAGIIFAGHDGPRRLMSGLAPENLPHIHLQSEGLTAWVTPPDYTGQDQITLDAKAPEPLHIPQGSLLKVVMGKKLTGSFLPARVKLGGKTQRLQKSEDGSYAGEFTIPDGHRFAVGYGVFGGRGWNYDFIPDTPPSLKINEAPEILSDGQIKFSVSMMDDYGVKTLRVHMALDPADGDAPEAEDFIEERSVMSPPQTDFAMTPVYDLTSHIWAGLPVIFTLSAIDHIGQTAMSDPITITLPEREFIHPVAKKLIKIRKYLAWNPLADYGDSITALTGLLKLPGEYQNDTRVFLALRVAASRLEQNEPSLKTAQSVMALLWDTALRLEDGHLSLAARDLRDAQMALEKALQNPATSDAEIAALMDKLREAMAAYLNALANEMQKRMAEGKPVPMVSPEVLQNMMNMDDLAAMLDKMESDMLSGDRNAARDMLSRLQRLMDMANPSMSMSLPPDMRMMSKGVNELEELIKKQEELLAQTREQADILDMLSSLGIDYGEALPPDQDVLEEWDLDDVPPQPGETTPAETPPFIKTEQNKVEQDALRYALGELMMSADKILGKIPENMGLAEQSMRGSAESLGNNRPDLSVPHQEDAIEYLKQAQKDIMQDLAKRMQQMTGLAFSGGQMRYDPLGRPLGRGDGRMPDPGSDVKIPGDGPERQVQEILKELRRRSSERERPPEELDYFHRLLRRF